MKDYHSGPGKYWEPFAFPVGCSGTEEEEGLRIGRSKPVPRYGYKPSPPNGCGSPLFGVHLNIGIPSLTKCCNQHDRCYETCGKSKNDCDEEFQYCLSKICRDVQKTLGLSQNVQACETTVELLFDSVIHLGCKPYLDSQRAACWCRYEEKTDL
ncbi:group XIIA secretory phospholipase A2 isoform 2 [Mus musculus]|uniref:Isoform 2 of Group XIIA secretory phospholipase A2 n=1 Tax=Mus musculus TaxID=10090 RepID=Q9EPR2-2|nr:group XIIA secretory phospholipase A2 isoform 2 [Mus musculus]AAG23337.1 group XII-2 phospholipase A2 [Mus musculus]EDL12226.1 phospholipase A2, group XIIA, isoform CRA_a [Mus musculus]|eukprot:NP_904359.1 group XIIA secretory phospholipase A2 isoform 2 [Mus musculus]